MCYAKVSKRIESTTIELNPTPPKSLPLPLPLPQPPGIIEGVIFLETCEDAENDDYGTLSVLLR